MNKSFNNTSHVAGKTISRTPSPKAIPSTGHRAPSSAKPAPLVSRCASCGRKK